MSKSLTQAQLDLIDELEMRGAPTFRGTTRKDASDYIEEWEERFYQECGYGEESWY